MMTFKINKAKLLLTCSLLFVILFQENLIYMTKSNTTFVLSIFGFIIMILRFKSIIDNYYYFKILIFMFIFIEIYGIVVAFFLYNQPISVGIYGTHYIFMYGWYFWFVDLIKDQKGKETAVYVKDFLIYAGAILAIMIIIQASVYKSIVFLKLGYSFRNGLRVVGSYIISYSLMFGIIDMIRGNRTKKKIISVILIAYYLIIYSQSRGLIITIILCGVILLFISCRKNYKKIEILLIPVLCIGIYLVIHTTYFQHLINEVVYEVYNQEGNGGVRIKAIVYYYDLLKKNMFLGIGILGDSFSLKPIIYGTVDHYFVMDDIGTAAFIFKTGILGGIWLIAFIIKIINLRKYYLDTFWGDLIVFFIIYILIGFTYTSIFDFKYGLIYFIIMLAMLERPFNEKLNRNF